MTLSIPCTRTSTRISPKSLRAASLRARKAGSRLLSLMTLPLVQTSSPAMIRRTATISRMAPLLTTCQEKVTCPHPLATTTISPQSMRVTIRSRPMVPLKTSTISARRLIAASIRWRLRARTHPRSLTTSRAAAIVTDQTSGPMYRGPQSLLIASPVLARASAPASPASRCGNTRLSA